MTAAGFATFEVATKLRRGEADERQVGTLQVEPQWEQVSEKWRGSDQQALKRRG